MDFDYQELSAGDIDRVAGLLNDMYEKNVRRFYSEEGDKSFRKSISAAEIGKRLKKGYRFFLLLEEDELLGGVEFNKKEIQLLFIVEEHRGKGYSRMIVNWLKEFYKKNKLGKKILVKASPNSYTAYNKLGFQPVGDEQEEKGIVFKKMELTIK